MMPLPWKKTKIVSRLVSDLRSSSKRAAGDSLVVHTGFPTSLVHLFVKNRDRLHKKNQKKKQKHLNRQRLQIPPPPPPPPIQCEDASVSSEEEPEEEEEEEEEEEDVCLVPNRVFKKLCLSIFLMLILALGTKKLALAITITAFLLLFLEFAGKRFICCTDARTNLISLFNKVLDSSAHLQKSNYLIQLPTTPTPISPNSIEAFIEESQTFEPPPPLPRSTSLAVFLEMGRTRTAMDTTFDHPKLTTAKRSKSLTAKSVKKYVLKKFRGSKKTKTKGGCQQEQGKGQRQSSDQLDELDENNEVSDDGEDTLGSEATMGDESKATLGDGSDYTDTSDLSFEEDDLGRRRRPQWSLGHCVPIVIALVGLVGGRILALVVTAVWCLLMNLLKLRQARRDDQAQLLLEKDT